MERGVKLYRKDLITKGEGELTFESALLFVIDLLE